jgi:rod shape determining protein RodA
MIAQRETGSALVFLSFLLVFYRQGMSGYILSWGVISIFLFIIVIRLGATPLPLGNGSYGIFLSTIIIETIIIGFLLIKEKKWILTIITATSIIGTFGIGLLLNLWIKVDSNLTCILSLIMCACILLFEWIRQKKNSISWLVVFIAVETIFCQGCDFAFQKVLQPHQRTRIEVLLGMKDDPNGAGYNVNQSLIAIGSGQLTGKGWTQGTQTTLKFVPEQDTDFIFCTVGEEWGFVGSAGVLILYLILILRIIHIAERQRDRFSMIYAYCVASILLFHVTINIGMVLGLLPVIGIPLPFFSYGGSSLWGFTLLLFIMLRMDAARVKKIV